MATASPAINECPVCFNIYSDDAYLPFKLSCQCGYTVCLACIKKISSEAKPVICPQCSCHSNRISIFFCKSCSKICTDAIEKLDDCEDYFCSLCLKKRKSEAKVKKYMENFEKICNENRMSCNISLCDDIDNAIDFLSDLRKSVADDALCLKSTDEQEEISMNDLMRTISEVEILADSEVEKYNNIERKLEEGHLNLSYSQSIINFNSSKYTQFNDKLENHVKSIKESMSNKTTTSQKNVQSISKFAQSKEDFPKKNARRIDDGNDTNYFLIKVNHLKFAVVGQKQNAFYIREIKLENYSLMKSIPFNINGKFEEIVGCSFLGTYIIYDYDSKQHMRLLINISSSTSEIETEPCDYKVIDMCSNNHSYYILEISRIVRMNGERLKHQFSNPCNGKITCTFNAKMCCLRKESIGIVIYSFDFDNSSSPLLHHCLAFPPNFTSYFMCQAINYQTLIVGFSDISELYLLDKKGNKASINDIKASDGLYLKNAFIFLANGKLSVLTN